VVIIDWMSFKTILRKTEKSPHNGKWHTYAIEELLASTDIHTLSKQMGTSVRMLEAHYSKLTATRAAERLA
jgi:hypothetical protein